MKLKSKTYEQEPHCCFTGCAEFNAPGVTLRLEDGGGGEFLVLNAYEYAMDTEAEIDALADMLKAMLGAAKE